MSTTTTDWDTAVKAQAEQIVTSGADIRPRLAEVVSQAACRSQQTGEGLVTLIRAVADGARDGLMRAVPGDRDDALRQVVDGVGDGLAQAALAGRLALEEAVGSARQFAEKDLVRLRDDLGEVRSLFAETVAQSLRSGKALTANQVAAARAHAGRVAERLGPVFQQVYDAIREHPVTFAREGFQAGVSAGRCAAGSLFEALGRMLQQAGGRMRQDG